MSNFLTVSTISYTPPDDTGLETGDWQKLLHKELKELVGNCTRSTQPDLIVLPETLLRKLAEPVPSGSTSQVLARLARKHNCWITVPVLQREPRTGNIFNVLALLDRQGKKDGVVAFPGWSRGVGASESVFASSPRDGYMHASIRV